MSENQQLQQKLHACDELIKRMGSVVVAFSGGVDSTLLLALAVRVLGPDRVLAALGVSASLPASERQSAHQLAQQIGCELVEVQTCEMSDPNFSANPPQRCFYCKSELFKRLNDLAKTRGFGAVVTGANADDAGDFRPGLQAGKQLGVHSPLMEAGLTKADIREASRQMGLETWDKAAMACLASRVPYGEQITPQKLARIEQAEQVLAQLGFSQYRVRDHEKLARIEVPLSELPKALQLREQIVQRLKDAGYTFVSVDLQGFRSGSMNETLAPRQRQGTGGVE